ncbi:MAG: Uma2 family endonuclease [Bacillaceae bacterium]|nr:Uma2 family endonuclease [Bacillaceae bacterium]
MACDNKLITAQELADNLNLSVETIWRYTREKKIPCVELGNKQYRYNLDEVIRALTDSTVVREKPVEYQPESDETFTYQDYLNLPEEPGYRYEVLNGILIKEPSPTVMHQRVSRRIQRMLEDYFWEVDPEGEIFNAPLDVTFLDTTVVQPDVFYISGKQKDIVKEKRIDGPPTLVVEVLSPSTHRKDRLKKLSIYQDVRVQHYWLVNPEDQTLECFALQNGVYALVAWGMDDEVVEHPCFDGLSMALKELWKS